MRRLLPTPAERVPAELAAAVDEFCRPIRAIRAAYLGLTEVTEDRGSPREQLAVGFDLDGGDDALLDLLAARFVEFVPDELQAGGCNVLEAGALGVWDDHAQRVFARAPNDVP
jgi:hypothetical protein